MRVLRSFVAAVVLTSGGTAAVYAVPRGAASRVQKATAAQKQQEIAQLKSSLATARRELDELRGQVGRSESQAADARSRTVSARQRSQDAVAAQREARKQLDAIEARIASVQPDDSPLAEARRALGKAQREVFEQMCRTLGGPPPDPSQGETDRLKKLGGLTSEQRQSLQSDERYIERLKALEAALAAEARIRRELFARDAEWGRLRDKLAAETKNQEEAERSRNAAASDSSGSRKESRTAGEQAAALQQAIMQIEDRLRVLGADPAK